MVDTIIASADVEVVEPPVPWKFLIVAVVEHGGSTDTTELCRHLAGSDRDPSIERLLVLAAQSGDLISDGGLWFTGPNAKAVLSEKDRVSSRSTEAAFLIGSDPARVVDVRLDESGRLRDVILGGAGSPVSPEESAVVRRVIGRRLPSGLRVLDIRDPLFRGETIDTRVLTRQELRAEDETAVIESVLPPGVRWDDRDRVAKSGLAAVLAAGDVLHSRTLNARASSVDLPSGGRLEGVEVTGIPWQADDGSSESTIAIANLAASTSIVMDEAMWAIARMDLIGIADGVSRRSAAELALSLGLRREHLLLMAGEDWSL